MDKAELRLGSQTFLERIVDGLQGLCAPIVLVGEVNRSRHQLPESIPVIPDEAAGRGPLEGIRVGLKHLDQLECSAALVTSCDAPLLKPAVIHRLRESLRTGAAVVPVLGPRKFGLTAIYRCDQWRIVEAQIARQALRVMDLAEAMNAQLIDAEKFRDVDPDLLSLTNVNSKDDYFRLLEESGESCPAHLAERLRS